MRRRKYCSWRQQRRRERFVSRHVTTSDGCRRCLRCSLAVNVSLGIPDCSALRRSLACARSVSRAARLSVSRCSSTTYVFLHCLPECNARSPVSFIRQSRRSLCGRESACSRLTPEVTPIRHACGQCISSIPFNRRRQNAIKKKQMLVCTRPLTEVTDTRNPLGSASRCSAYWQPTSADSHISTG
jgi:hypothetical protein